MTASQKPMTVPPVKSAIEAKELWSQFHKKYANLRQAEGVVAPGKFADVVLRRMSQAKAEKPKTKPQVLADNKTAPKVALSEADAAKKIQKVWRGLRSTGKPIGVRLGKKHNPMAHFVLHKQNVKKSLHHDKLIELQTAIDKASIVAPIFNDPLLAELVLKLFLDKKIQEHQFFSILDRVQIAKQYHLKKYYRILDEHGQFTKEAREIFLKGLQNRKYLRPLTDAEIESFRHLIAALPLSEQYFFTSDLGPNRGHDLKDTYLKQLLDLDALQLEQHDLVHLSFGVRDALGLACYGLKEYVRPIPQIGMQALDDTENGVRQKVRSTAMHFPGIRPFHKVHGNFVTYMEATRHDFYHANGMSVIPDQLLEVLLRFVDLARALGFRWSKEVFQWIDCELNYFLHNNNLALQASDPYSYLLSGKTRSLYDKSFAEMLCDLLLHENTKQNTRVGGYLVTYGQITPVGVMIFLNMIMEPKAWERLQINPSQLVSPFKEHYKAIQKIYPLMQNDELTIKLLKCLCYFELKRFGADENFPAFNEMIDKNRDALLAKMQFVKISSQDAKQTMPDLKNMIRVGVFDERAQNIFDVVLDLEYTRLFGRHRNFNVRESYSYFGKAIVNDSYSYSKAVHYAGLRLEGQSETNASLKTHWASMFSELNPHHPAPVGRRLAAPMPAPVVRRAPRPGYGTFD